MCLPRFGCSETQWTQGFWGPAACAGEATGGTQTTHERRAIADSRGARPPVAEHSSRTKGGQQTRGSEQRERPRNLSEMPSAGISTSAPRTPIRVGFRTSDMPRGQSQGVESNGQGVRAGPRYTSGRLIVTPRPPAPFAGFGDGSTVANSDSIIGTPADNQPPPDTRFTKRRVAGLAIRELTANGPRVLARRVHLSAPDGFVELGAHARRSTHDQGLPRFARMPIHGSSELAQ